MDSLPLIGPQRAAAWALGAGAAEEGLWGLGQPPSYHSSSSGKGEEDLPELEVCWSEHQAGMEG